MLQSNTVQQLELAVVDELEDEFAEEAVLPGEPFAGEVLGIIDVKGFVHKAGAGICLHQKFYAPKWMPFTTI